MFTLSIIRMFFAAIGLFLLGFGPKFKISAYYKAYYSPAADASIVFFSIAFVFALLQRTLFLPAQCTFYIFFILMHIADKVKKNYLSDRPKYLQETVQKIYKPLYWFCALCFSIVFFISLCSGIAKISNFTRVKDKATYSVKIYEYDQIDNINFATDGKSFFVSSDNFNEEFVSKIDDNISYEKCADVLKLNEENKGEITIKSLKVEMYYRYTNVKPKYYSLYNWFNMFFHKYYTIYVVGY